MRRQPGGGAPGYVLDQRRVCDHEPLTAALVAFLLIAPPEFAQLDRFDVRLQGFPPRAGGRQLMPEGDCARRRFEAWRTLPECKSGCWKRWRARASPGSPADRRLRRAGAWRSCDAASEASPPP